MRREKRKGQWKAKREYTKREGGGGWGREGKRYQIGNCGLCTEIHFFNISRIKYYVVISLNDFKILHTLI